jgi:Rieske Fe-S protein
MSLPPMTRASALRGAVVTLAAAAAGFAVARVGDLGSRQAGPAAANAYGAAPSGGGPLAAVDDVPPGGGLVLADEGVVLVRGEGDDVHAFSATCTHQGCPVSEVTDGRILCPCHGSVFDAASGDVVEGPAPSALAPVEVTVRDGSVLAG